MLLPLFAQGEILIVWTLNAPTRPQHSFSAGRAPFYHPDLIELTALLQSPDSYIQLYFEGLFRGMQLERGNWRGTKGSEEEAFKWKILAMSLRFKLALIPEHGMMGDRVNTRVS